MEQNPSFQYSAFISYRHVPRDRKWAEWLVQALETYRVPKELLKAGYPARLGKVFRDRDELPSSGSLNRQIESALRASRYLIVICSPDTPSSRWVSREIELFKELGRADKIIPLLVEGEPRDAFPKVLTTTRLIGFDEANSNPPLPDWEPIGADVRSLEGLTERQIKKTELLRLVASILGCAFDDLYQRDAQRESQKKRNQLAVIAITFFAVICASLGYWDYNRIKTRYFSYYSMRFDVPVGHHPVSDSQARRMEMAYAIEYQRGKTIAMTHVKGAAKPIPMGDSVSDYDVHPWLKGVARWRFDYQRSGELARVTYSDAKGKLKLTALYEFNPHRSHATITFKVSDAVGKTAAATISNRSSLFEGASKVKTEISQHYATFNDKGQIIRREFQNYYAQAVTDEQGRAGNRYQYDESGLLAEVGFLDVTGEPLITKEGINAVKIDRHKTGFPSRISFLGHQGQPVFASSGYAIAAIQVDAFGNGTRIDYLGLDQKPVVTKDGFSSIEFTYDARGNQIEAAYFGTDGKLILHKGGYAKITAAYDARGNEIESACFGTDGQPVLSSTGIAKITSVYDAQGNQTETAYFGTDGQPILSKNGYAKWTAAYDARGNQTEVAYFGTVGQPALSKDGYAKWTAAYDARGNQTEAAYFGTDGQPILSKDGYAKWTAAYDARGNQTEAAYFGTDNQPILSKNGYAKWTAAYDARGNQTVGAYFGTDGQPILGKDGYARVTAAYDASGLFA